MTEDKDQQFESVMDQFRGLIYKIANGYSNNREDLNDLIQEIALQMWRSFDCYNPEFKRSTWIYRIALNTAISFLRKNTTRDKYVVDSEHLLLEAHAASEDGKRDFEINKILQRLGKLDRALMILHLDERDYQEISKILNISASNVGTKISRIKHQLTIEYQEDK